MRSSRRCSVATSRKATTSAMPAVLAELAASAGLDRDRVEQFLASDEGTDAVSAAELDARRHQVSGVPTFIINGEPAFAGAQPAELILAHLLAAAGDR